MITARHTVLRPVHGHLAATIVLAAAMSVATPNLAAQRRGPAQNTAHRSALHLVERTLRLGDRLELTQEQRDRLEAMRAGMVERQADHSARRMRLASEVRAGLGEAGTVREALAAMREESGTSRREFRAKYGEIFTDEQKQQLRRLNRQGAWRQRGARGGGPGWNRGRGIRGRGEMDRGRGGDRFRGWRSPGGRGW